MSNAWYEEFTPSNVHHIDEVVTKYEIDLHVGEESGVKCWIADYETETGTQSTSFFGVDSPRSKDRSILAAALMCFLRNEKDVEYPLCRELAIRYCLAGETS